MEQLARKIRKHREIMEFSQEYMANELQISQPAYAKIELGRTRVGIERLLRIATILQVDPQELLEGERTINQINNDQAYGFVENIYQDNKEVYQKLILQLENENRRLIAENNRLLKIINK